MKIVIIGGTGLIGTKLVAKLREGRHEVVAAAPDTGVNTLTGEGLAEALRGAAVVVDVCNSPSSEGAPALDFFLTSTRNLLAYESRAGVRHHIGLSVVGTDRLAESGYFRAKLAQERLIKSAARPYTIVHATQFFELFEGIADTSTYAREVRLPPVMFQPMAADDVASALADVAVSAPANGVIEVAGPEPFRLDELVQRRLAALDDPRVVVADPAARYAGARVTNETLMPAANARLGETTFDAWLARPVPARPPQHVEPQMRISAHGDSMWGDEGIDDPPPQ